MRTRAPGESALLLLDAVDVLNAHQVKYAVIGALAACVHGAVRASLDADVVVSAGVVEGGRMERAFTDAGFRAELARGDPDDPIPGMLHLSDEFENRVDLLLGIRGLDPKAFGRTVQVPFQGTTLEVIGREDFIAMKVFAGGPIDLADAASAIAADPKSLDVGLVRRLAARFGRDASTALDSLLSKQNRGPDA